MTYPSLIKSLELFKTYLESDNPDSSLPLEEFLLTYERSDARRDFYLVPIGEPKITGPILRLFDALDVDKSLWLLYFDPKLSVYQFLKELHEKTNSTKLNYLLKRIDVHTARSKWQLFLMGLFFIGAAVAAYFVPPIHALLSAAMNLTIAGLVYTSTVSFLKLRENYYGSKIETQFSYGAQIKTQFGKAHTLFLVTSTVLNLTAYALWIGAEMAMSPLIAGLFIGASVLDACRELYIALENRKHYLEQKELLSTIGPSEAQAIKTERASFELERHRNAAVINCTAAVILVGLIAAWCLVPSSILTTLAIIATIVVVQAIKNFFNKCNDSRNKVRLTAALESIHDDEMKKTQTPSASYSPLISITSSRHIPRVAHHPPLFVMCKHSPMPKRKSDFRRECKTEPTHP